MRYVRIEAFSYQHTIGDRRPPTAYEVYDGDRRLGIVRSKSEESWRKSRNGKYRTGFIGYSRSWEAINSEGKSVTRWALTRKQAAEALR